jgi:aminoglycoside phosphotransferase (APT) family kinase protein
LTDLASRLAACLAGRLGEPVEVGALHQLAGGASRETWAFDASVAGRVLPLVLRRDPPGRPGRDCAGALRLRAAARAAGVPVPDVLCSSSDAAELGAPFIVMERIEGEAIPRRILRDDAFASARPVLVAQSARALARIHTVPVAGLEFLGPALAPLELVQAQQDVLDTFGEPHPVFELALRWLRGRALPTGRAGVVHGDFRLGNLMVGREGLRAVLDWELAHVGEPAEDLGWYCVRAWRFGSDALAAGGLGSRGHLLDAYAAAGGAPVDAVALRWWEAYGSLRWGIMCLLQASFHLSGAVRSVELAAIGRRAGEMEWALLDLMDGKE